MKKTYKGYELLKSISNGEIKADTKIKVSNNLVNLIYDGHTLRWENSSEIAWVNNFTNENITFELIEDEDIDIQDIEIIKEYRTSDNDLYNDNFEDFRGTINDLVQAVKQLDKRTREEKK